MHGWLVSYRRHADCKGGVQLELWGEAIHSCATGLQQVARLCHIENKVNKVTESSTQLRLWFRYILCGARLWLNMFGPGTLFHKEVSVTVIDADRRARAAIRTG